MKIAFLVSLFKQPNRLLICLFLMNVLVSKLVFAAEVISQPKLAIEKIAKSSSIETKVKKSTRPEGIYPFEISLSGVHTGKSELDGIPSDLQRSALMVEFSAKFPLSRKVFIGLSLGYDRLNYDWTKSVIPLLPSINNTGDWSNIKRNSASLSVIYRPNEQWLFIFSPKVQESYAAGASSSHAVSYGGVATAMHYFSSGNMLGGGLAYLNDLDDVRVIPFIAVRWQINDKWSLTNPFQTGFSGPAGLELRNKISKNWLVGFGSSRRTQRFLLNDKPQYAEIEEWVAFTRLQWAVNPQLTFNALGGFYYQSELTISNPDVAYELHNQAGLALQLDYRF